MAIHIDTDGNFWFGQTGSQELSEISYTPVFSVTKTGVLTATSGTVGGWELANTYLRASDGTNYITLNNNGSISGNYSQNTAGWIISADGSAEFNNVTVRGDLIGVELAGTLDFNGGTFRTSASTPRIEITDNSQREGEIRYETSLGTAMRLAVESTSPSDFFIENGILNGDTRIITSTGGIISLEGDTLNLSNGTSNNDPILTFNGINAASKTSTTLSKLLGVTSSGRLAVGSATSGVASLSVSGVLGLSGSSGILNIHHDESDHTTFAASSHNHDGEYVDTVSGSTDALTISGRNITLNFGTTGTRVAAGNHDHDSDYAAVSHGSHVSSSTAVQALYPGGLRGSVTLSASSGGRFVDYIGQSGQTINLYTTNYAGTTLYTRDIYPDSNADEDIGNNFGNGRYKSIYLINAPNYTSDERLKNTIEDIPYGIDYLNTLRPVQYEWNRRTRSGCLTSNYVFQTKSDGETLETECPDCVENEIACVVGEIDTTGVPVGQKSWGFIAQEVLNTPPETDLDIALVDYNETSDEYGLKGTELLAPLVKAVQELSTQISELTARIEALEG
jgi:hypothetical protein